ncbi:MAG TPA: hypothetical protein VI758_04675 [Bacteroidota bacterium]
MKQAPIVGLSFPKLGTRNDERWANANIRYVEPGLVRPIEPAISRNVHARHPT